MTPQHGRSQSRNCGSSERHIPNHHEVQEYAQRPHVHKLADVMVLGEQFWGSVRGRTAERVQLLHWLLQTRTEAKVGQLDLAFGHQQHVLRFYVAVHKRIGVLEGWEEISLNVL